MYSLKKKKEVLDYIIENDISIYQAKEKVETSQKEEKDKLIEMEAIGQAAGTAITNPSSNINYQGSSAERREPDVLSSYDEGNLDTVEGKITMKKLTTEYNAMIESVLKYKGFYVARYEAGLDVNNNIVFKNASVVENNVTTADASNIETKTWYGLYTKIKTFTTDSDKVVSSMIWGSQYDAMMNWMAKNNKTVGTADDLIYNNTTKTGNKSTDVINNVYDLYGCHYEWTLEAHKTDYRVERGGYSGGFNAPSNNYNTSPNLATSYDTSRATLYVK